MRYHRLIAISWIGILTLPAWGDARAVNRFLAAKKTHQVSPALSYEQAASDPASWRGRVVEVRGTISGVAQMGETTTFIVNTKSGEALLKAASSSDLPSNGETIRALARIPEDASGSIGSLAWVEWVGEFDMLEREAQWAAQQQKSALGRRKASLKRSRAYTSTRSNFPSRGAYSPFDPGVVDAYTRAILYFNPRLPAAHADLITQSILAYSVHYNVDARLIVAIIAAESRFNPNATSRKGAMGLGQLMPGTARGLGVSNAYDPQQNVAGSVRMVRGLLEKYMGSHTWQGQSYDPESIALALASYNAGSGAVRRYKGIPPYRETRNYVVKVWNLYRQLCGG